MKNSVLILLSFLVSIAALAQDTYHTSLQNTLQNNFGLPEGSWGLNDSEAANLSADYTWGSLSSTNQPATMQPFSQKVNLQISSGGSNQWDAGYAIKNINTIGNNSVCLLVIWVRAEGGDGQVSLFAENSSTYAKEVYLTFTPTDQWTQYLVPFEASQAYSPGGISFGMHLAWQAQTIEIGGIAVLDYGNSISIADLPNQTNNDQYGGWEPDAPWRAEAAERIDQLRKADLTVRVEDANGNPIEGAAVAVEMLSHKYAFGSAVVSRLFAGNNSHSATYESKLLDLDGNGHGFNWVVFENALKWPGWEQNWITSKPETANAVQWLRDRDIQIRGHCLVWPGWSNLPSDMQNNQNNPAYMKDRIFNHIEAINTYPGIEGNIAEWDVLNEITTNRSLEYALQGTPGYITGREIYPEIFQKLQEVAPGMKTYINDYVTISQANTGGGNYDLKKQFAQELIDAGVQLDGIGFQGHIGAFPTSIYAVQTVLDDFYNTFGTTAKITEYDTHPDMGDDLAGVYMRDFLTMVFSHESTDGFMMWGFWDGAHWHGNAPMFAQDWTIKPAGESFIDLVFNEWWTAENGATDANGNFTVRGFKGKYQVTVDCGNEVLTDTFYLHEDMVLVKKDGEISTGTTEKHGPDFLLFPNPSHDYLNIEWGGSLPADIRFFDATGKEVYFQKIEKYRSRIKLDFGKGAFTATIGSGDAVRSETIIIH